LNKINWSHFLHSSKRFYKPTPNEPHNKQRAIQQFLGPAIPSKFPRHCQEPDYALKRLTQPIKIPFTDNQLAQLPIKLLGGQAPPEEVYKADEGVIKDGEL
jgi:hypothetical protein